MTSFNAASYGVNETNGIQDVQAWQQFISEAGHTHLGDSELAKITRLRLLTERGYPYFDISYCYGELKDGTAVRIDGVPMHLSRKTPKADLIAWAKSEGAFAKGLGLLDEGNWSVLYG
jgi:hypothetical protein